MRVWLDHQKLAAHLARSPLSQNHWALKLGLSKGHWSDLVNGKHPHPSAKTRERMLEVLGLRFEDLFEVETGIPGWADSDFRRAIADRYLIDSELGQGGMGAVYLARDARHGRIVAIKVISPEAVSGIGVTAFLREIATVAQLQHPNILTLHDSGEAAGHPFYVMPFIRGGSLRGRLERETRLSPHRVAGLVEGIASGLQHAHEQRILHCDIKPENILLDGNHPYLMDFGIARKLHAEVLPWTLRRELDFSAGTPAYVSPEQASGDSELTPASDVYSLACVVYEMLSGRPPFEGSTTQSVVTRRFISPPPPIRDFAPEVPAPLEAAVNRGMVLDPQRRTSSAPAFARAVTAGSERASARLSAISRFLTRGLDRLRLNRRRRAVRIGAGGSFRQDLLHAWRGLRRAPGFALVVILTLGLALGSNATMFGITDRLLLRPPAGIGHPDAVRRVLVARWLNGLGEPRPAMSFPHFEDFRDKTRSFTHVATFEEAIYSYGTGSSARPVSTLLVSGQYFALLEVPRFLGRYFGDPEDQPPSGTTVAVLSHRFWRSVFAGDSSVIGRTMPLGNHPYTIIGVASPGFNGTGLAPVDAWVPLSTLSLGLFDDPGWRTSRGSQWLQSLVRLRPGVPEATAEEDATRAYRSAHLDAQNPFHRKAIVRLGSIVAGEDPLAGGTSGKARTSRVALWLLGVTVILLVIACTNVANLMLARGLTRRGEIAVRMALGVSRLRLARQLLTESLMLAGLGVLLGLALLRFATPLIRAVLLPNTAWDASPVNARVLLVTLGAGVLAALVAGLFPLWRASRSDLAQQLHGTGKSTSAPAQGLRTTLLLVQTSLAALLMIGALLFVQSMRRIHGLDLGFAPDRLAMASVDLSWVGASKAEAAAFYREASIRLRATPGILGVGSSIGAPFLSNWSEELRVQGLDSLPRLAGGGPYYVRASAGFLEALDARVVRGRTLTEADERPDAPAVALVTERTASTLWPEQDPIGRCLLVGSAEVCHTVVGVVHDLNRQALDEASRPFLLYFTPLGRAPVEETVPEQLFIRTDGPPERFLEGIRQVLLTVRPDLPFVRIEPFQDLLDRHARSWSLGATLLTVFGGMSLVIAAIGLYGVLAYTVTQRQRELGIRSALGATPRNLLKLVVRGGVVTAGAGLLIGAGLALLVSNRVQELLFRTSARDPVVYFATAAMVLALAFIASAIPAQRATRTNPLEVLRTE